MELEPSAACQVGARQLLFDVEESGALALNRVPDANRPQHQWKQGKPEHFRVAVVKVSPESDAAHDEHKDRCRHSATK